MAKALTKGKARDKDEADPLPVSPRDKAAYVRVRGNLAKLAPLGASDDVLAALPAAAHNDNQLEYELGGSFSRWVGRIAIAGVIVTIGPKPYVPIGCRALLELQMIALGADDFSADAEATDGLPIDDYAKLVVCAFSHALQRALRRTRGALADYRVVRGSCSMIRGRIEVRASLKRPLGLDCPPLICVFDELTIDTPQNQLLKAAASQSLAVLRQREPSSLSAATTEAVGRLRASERQLSGVAAHDFTARELMDFDMKPRIARYRPYRLALLLGRLILSHSSADASGAQAGISFLVNLDSVFEEFVRRAFSVILPVKKGEKRLAAHGSGDSVASPTFEPDLVSLAGGRVVGDAKYKRLHLRADGKLLTNREDVFQILAYMTAYDASCGVLVYGASDPPTYADPMHTPYELFLRRVLIPDGRPLLIVCLDLRKSTEHAAAQLAHTAKHCMNIANAATGTPCDDHLSHLLPSDLAFGKGHGCEWCLQHG